MADSVGLALPSPAVPREPAVRPIRARSFKRGAAKRKHSFAGWMFVLPFMVIFAVFLVAPLAYAFYLSLFTKGLATGTTFTGLAQYVKAFTDPSFIKGAWFV